VTCPSLASGPATPDDGPDQPQQEHAPTQLEKILVRFRQDDAFAQLTRFALVGGTSTLLYALIFLALHPLGYLPAHVTATVVSSVVVNELHRRVSFHAGRRVGFLAAQWEAGTVSLIGLAATSGALGWLAATTTDAPAVLQIGLVVAVTAVIGTLRFLALRWLFRGQQPADA
jgi:putative flippase GtrA